MPKPPNPQTLVIDGRTLVNRDWIIERTGAGRSTATLWYAKRDEQPDGARHPEKATTIDRIDYYDQEAFEAFYAALQERKKATVHDVDPALYDGDVDDWISINVAADWFGFRGPTTIHKYLHANPGYFPAPVGTVEGPTGRPIRAFRRGDLQGFDRSRTGKGRIGAAGRKPGPRPSRGRSTQVTQRIETAVAYLKEIGGYRRGVAAELAAHRGDPTWKWERAVKEARNLLQSDPSHQAEGR